MVAKYELSLHIVCKKNSLMHFFSHRYSGPSNALPFLQQVYISADFMLNVARVYLTKQK